VKKLDAPPGDDTLAFRSGTPLAGITAVAVQDKSSRTPGLVRVTVKGKGGSYAISPADLSQVRVEVILDPPAAETGECADARFPGLTALSCVFNSSGSTLTCR